VVPVIAILDVKQLPFNCDHFPDKWLAIPRNVMRMKLSGRLPIVQLPAFCATACETCEDKCCQDGQGSCSHVISLLWPNVKATHPLPGAIFDEGVMG